MLSPANFWNQSIIEWERKRYLNPSLFNRSVLARLKYFKNRIESWDRPLRVLELGCGSGVLFNQLDRKNIKSYTAVDASTLAIAKFQKILDQHPHPEVKLICSTIEDLNVRDIEYFDVVISAGLIDWLSSKELMKLIELCKGKYFIHSFSEKRLSSPSQMLHRAYQSLRRSDSKSKYHARNEIKDLFSETSMPSDILRYPGGSFGRVILCAPRNKTAVSRHFESRAQTYNLEQKKFPWAFLKKLEGQLWEHVQYDQNSWLLSVGAGCSILKKTKENHEDLQVHEMDLSLEMLKFASNADYKVHGDFETFDFQQLKFDSVLLIGVLEFFQDPMKALRKAHTILKPRGQLLVMAPRLGIFGSIYKYYHRRNQIDVRLFEEAPLREAIEKLGFTIQQTKRLPFWCFGFTCTKI